MTDPSKAHDPKVLLKVGGQRIALPTNQIVDLARALQAARWFREQATPHPELVWVED